MIVYFGEEVEKALRDYLEISRNAITPLSGHEDALFLSGQRKRISVDAVEKMVKKYASAISAKTITPHKLRSTYGTALYRETGDIYLVADVLGHADVNTTKKHYAKLSDARRRAASKAVHCGKKQIRLFVSSSSSAGTQALPNFTSLNKAASPVICFRRRISSLSMPRCLEIQASERPSS